MRVTTDENMRLHTVVSVYKRRLEEVESRPLLELPTKKENITTQVAPTSSRLPDTRLYSQYRSQVERIKNVV